MVEQPIQRRRRYHLVPEDRPPLLEPLVRSQHRGRSLVALIDELEEERGPVPGHRRVARISHTHGPKRTPGNRNLLTRKTVTREARIPTDLTACRMGDTDFQLVAVKEQVSQVRHHARWRRRSGSPHRENWPEVGVPLPARRSAWWLGRHAPAQKHHDLLPLEEVLLVELAWRPEGGRTACNHRSRSAGPLPRR